MHLKRKEIKQKRFFDQKCHFTKIVISVWLLDRRKKFNFLVESVPTKEMTTLNDVNMQVFQQNKQFQEKSIKKHQNKIISLTH